LEEGEGGRRSGKARVADQTAGMTERASTPSSICLSDPQGRDEAVAQEGAQNRVKKGVHFWDPSIEGERAREPRGAHPLARCERHGVGELRADFSSIVRQEIGTPISLVRNDEGPFGFHRQPPSGHTSDCLMKAQEQVSKDPLQLIQIASTRSSNG
jgi:hypothetical protein